MPSQGGHSPRMSTASTYSDLVEAVAAYRDLVLGRRGIVDARRLDEQRQAMFDVLEEAERDLAQPPAVLAEGQTTLVGDDR